MWQQHSAIRVFRAVDFGFSPDPAYCLWIAHLGNRYIAFKEKLWLKTIASDIAKDIVEESTGMAVSATYCDPSMDTQTGADIRTIKDIFEENGVPMENSINNREFYAQSIHQALGEEVEPGLPRLQILKLGCPYLIKTLPHMRYNEKRPNAMADHKHDHAAVALAYFLISHASNEQRSFSQRVVPKWMRPKKPLTDWILGQSNVRNLKH